MFISKWVSILGITQIFFLLTLVSSVTITSVDFGSEWMKVAVVAPGVPMEIALNQESHRKTPMAISYRNGERAFGEGALSAGMKAPKACYAYFLDLLGKKIDNPMVEIFRQRFPYYDLVPDPKRGTVMFRQDENTTFSVEELVAQMLDHARELAAAHTNQRTKDLVITVPPFFSQAERRALLEAAELVGVKVLSLMTTNAAVALNYGMFRRKEINETAQNILFYDMGASSTTATIVSYQTVKTKDRGFTESNPQVSILGVGFDRSLGGLEMQLRMRDFLANKFNDMKKTPKNVFESPRAMSKLMKAAGKVKQVLSANSEYLCQVEGVLDDIDFSLKVTRQDFESLCTDLFERVRFPIDDALISSGMDISNIHQFIIVGGNTRIPKIQSILQEVWGKELGKNINADEAAALGAVYRAADLGQGFKVLKFHVKESVIYPIEVHFERLIEAEDGSSNMKSIKRSLFAVGNQYPQKKVMTFNRHTEDFEFSVNYGDLTHLKKSQYKSLGFYNVSQVSVTGVTDAFKKYITDEAEPKGIKSHFTMDDSGILSISAVEALFEKNVTVEADSADEEESTFSKIGSTISKLFSGGEGEESDNSNSTNSTAEEEAKPEKDNTDKVEEKTKENNPKPKEKEFKPKLVTVKEELNFTVQYLDLPFLNAEQLKSSQEKLHAIRSAEKDKQENEKAKNGLESYILEVQDKITQEEYEAASIADTRAEIKALASSLEEWLYDEGWDEETTVYKDRRKSLEKLFEPIRKRVKLHQERPEALKALHDMINVSSAFLQRASELPEDDQLFTDVEIKTLDDLIIDTQKWIEEKEELQSNTPLYEEPKLTISGVGEKIGALDREIKYLVNKAKLAKAKKDKEAAEAKAKAEKEAREAEKKKNESSKADKDKDETQDTGSESRQEPVLPTEPEEGETPPENESQENDEEEDRRKEFDENLAHDEM